MPDIKLNFDKMDGLIPVVIQDYENNEVLMIGFMNREAWDLTQKTGKMHYWSRKKKRLWMKGEQSGHFQYVKEIYTDNDYDSLLIKVNQIGGAVEDGYRSCFYFLKNGNGWTQVGKKVFDPEKVYKKYSETIFIGVPSGSLHATTLELFEYADMPLKKHSDRDYILEMKDSDNIRIIVVRAEEIPRLLQEGEVDIGLTGSDLVDEAGFNVTDLVDLGYNKHGLGPVQWVLAVPNQNRDRYHTLRDFEGKTICTELPHTTQKKFVDRGIEVHIDRSIGTTEAKAPSLCDAIVDVCETGTSLRENDLCPLYVVRKSTVHLYAHNESMGFGWKRRKIESIAEKLTNASQKLSKNSKILIQLPHL